MGAELFGGIDYARLREELEALLAMLEVGLDSGTATGGSSTTLEDSSKDWGADQWADAYVEITEGTGKGQIRKIASNTSNTITVETAWTTIPDTTSKYRIFGAPAEVRTLQNILSQLDITLSNLRDTLDSRLYNATDALTVYDHLKQVRTQIDSYLVNLDTTLSDLRDALKPTRATPVQDLSAVSIAAGGVQNIDKSALDGYSAVIVTVKATYDAAATAGVRVRWLYSPDGTNYDSPEDAVDAGNYEDLTFAAGATRMRTILIPVFQPYVRIQVVNLDGTYAVTVDAWTVLLR